MSKIREAFEKGKAFIPFITCGDPDLETTAAAVREMVKNGADLIELGIPFSDPTAEGPTIQGANLRALQGGVTTDKVFELVRDLRSDVFVPMVFMTYANVVYSYGAEKFISLCSETGIDGLILPDLPYEETDNPPQEIIKMNKVTIQYGPRIILSNLDWTVLNGERWALSGQNGAGKSTLLSLVCADNPQSYACDITLFGRPRGTGESIWDIKKHIGYVSPEMHRAYQKDLPAIRIVASGLKDSVGLYVKPTEEDYEICRKWMRIFGLEGLEERTFLKLSSGEQRLVLLARAFVKDPRLLILDEPLHGLDNTNRRLVKDIIETFCQRKNKTMIMVTHYQEELPACITHHLELYRKK